MATVPEQPESEWHFVEREIDTDTGSPGSIATGSATDGNAAGNATCSASDSVSGCASGSVTGSSTGKSTDRVAGNASEKAAAKAAHSATGSATVCEADQRASPSQSSTAAPHSSEAEGVRLFHEGRFREALCKFRNMKARASECGRPLEEGRAMRLIGNALDKTGAPSAEVEEAYRLALKAAHQHDDMELSFNTLTGMASHAGKQGDVELAEHFYLQALTLAKRVLTPREEAVGAGNLAMCLARSDSQRAMSFQHFQTAMNFWAQAESNDDLHSRAVLAANYASALGAEGRFVDAEVEYKLALEIARKAQDRRVEANVLTNLANIYDSELNRPSAAQSCREAIVSLGTVPTNAGDGRNCAVCLEHLEDRGGASHRPVTVLPCYHAYHTECWQNCAADQCPLCRDRLSFATVS